MRDILNRIEKWQAEGKEFCIATVTRTWRSSPRPVGSSMIVSASGEMLGSVSGGCVEKSVLQSAIELLAKGTSKVLSFGVADEDAWNVGLSCGGRIEVLLEKFPPLVSNAEDGKWKELLNNIQKNKDIAWVSNMSSDVSDHILISPGNGTNTEIEKLALERLAQRKSEVVEADGTNYFVHSFPAKNRLIMIGSAHITSELIVLAKMHDFETIVIDPRDTFANKSERLEEPDQLFVKWPQEILPNLSPDQNTYAVILSHDPKIDDAALEILLSGPAKYIGALGSKKTHERRKERLLNSGFSDKDISRIYGPVGLDINAMSAKEIALSIIGEIIKIKNIE